MVVIVLFPCFIETFIRIRGKLIMSYVSECVFSYIFARIKQFLAFFHFQGSLVMKLLQLLTFFKTN